MRDRHARAAVGLLLLGTLAPAPSVADCDTASLLADVRTQVTSLHDTFSSNAKLTVPLDVADDRITKTAGLITQGSVRKTRRQIRSVMRKIRTVRRRVLMLERHHGLEQAAADDAVARADAAIAILQILLESAGGPPLTCPTTTTVTTTSTTATTNTSDTSTTTTSTKTTRIIATFPTVTLITIPPPARLDYTAPGNFGEANLSKGFAPDPYSVGMTTGGRVDVSYLGSSCAGFASVAPDLRINFGGGAAALLRIYFVGSNGDATMIVNDAYGNFYCLDDSFGTENPNIDFNDPTGGTYDVWIGSFSSSSSISGTLYVTENGANHP